MTDFDLWEAPSGEGTAIAYRGPKRLNAVRQGRVKLVHHPIHFNKRSAELADGTYLELDSVIMATGFLPVLQ